MNSIITFSFIARVRISGCVMLFIFCCSNLVGADCFSLPIGETFQCAQTEVFYDPGGGLQEVSGFTVGPTNAYHDGLNDFSGSPPVDFEDSFFAGVSVSAPINTPVESFTVSHRSNAVFTPNEANLPTSVLARTIGDVVFTVLKLDQAINEDFDFRFDHTADYALLSQFDDGTAANVPDGLISYSAMTTLEDANSNVLSQFFGTSGLQTENFDLTSSGDFASASVDSSTPGQVELGVDIFKVFNSDTVLQAERFRLATNTDSFSNAVEILGPRLVRFGARVGFTYEVTVSSPDPNVRFSIIAVPEPSSLLLVGLASSCLLVVSRGLKKRGQRRN